VLEILRSKGLGTNPHRSILEVQETVLLPLVSAEMIGWMQQDSVETLSGSATSYQEIIPRGGLDDPQTVPVPHCPNQHS